jgi:GTPase SAR1 family protein
MVKKKFSLEEALDNLNVLAEMTSSGPSDNYITRPFSPIQEISRLLSGKSTQQKFLLAGQDGCGKTTELNRLEEMEKEKYFVVRCHHEHLYDMGEADSTGFLLVLLRALADAVETISNSLSKHIADSSRKILKPSQGFDLDIVFPILGIKFTHKTSSKESAKDRRGDTREQAQIRSELDKFRSELISIVHKVIEEIQEDRKKPLLILVDDLEKIRYQDVYRLVSENAQLLSSLPFSAVYTVPLEILFDRKSNLRSEFHIVNLANLPIFYDKLKDKKMEVTFKFLHKMAKKRIGQFWTELDSKWAVTVMIISGGHLRQYLSLLRFMLLELFETDSPKIEIKHIRRAIIKIHSGLRRLVSEKDIEILEKFNEPQQYINAESQRLLRNYLILEYYHEDIDNWYLSNPLVVRSTIETLLNLSEKKNEAEHALNAG